MKRRPDDSSSARSSPLYFSDFGPADGEAVASLPPPPPAEPLPAHPPMPPLPPIKLTFEEDDIVGIDDLPGDTAIDDADYLPSGSSFIDSDKRAARAPVIDRPPIPAGKLRDTGSADGTDEEEDILSALPQPTRIASPEFENTTALPPEEKGTSHPLPPSDEQAAEGRRPLRVEHWFEPSETEATPTHPLRVENWFERAEGAPEERELRVDGWFERAEGAPEERELRVADWFERAENAPKERSLRVENWFEPPEGGAATASDAGAVSGNELWARDEAAAGAVSVEADSARTEEDAVQPQTEGDGLSSNADTDALPASFFDQLPANHTHSTVRVRRSPPAEAAETKATPIPEKVVPLAASSLAAPAEMAPSSTSSRTLVAQSAASAASLDASPAALFDESTSRDNTTHIVAAKEWVEDNTKIVDAVSAKTRPPSPSTQIVAAKEAKAGTGDTKIIDEVPIEARQPASSTRIVMAKDGGADSPERATISATVPGAAGSNVGNGTPSSNADLETSSFGAVKTEAPDAPDTDVMDMSSVVAPAAAAPPAHIATVNAADVFANMGSFDDDGGLDDEMRALLADGDAPAETDGDDTPLSDASDPAALAAMGPLSLPQRITALARQRWEDVVAAVALRENWRLYCDLLAVLIATVSLAVIIAWYKWHR